MKSTIIVIVTTAALAAYACSQLAHASHDQGNGNSNHPQQQEPSGVPIGGNSAASAAAGAIGIGIGVGIGGGGAGGSATSSATNSANVQGGSTSTRAFAFGASAAANNNTCAAPWLWGGVQIESETCVLLELSDRLRSMGRDAEALRLLCQSARIYAAFADSGAASAFCGDNGPVGWRVYSNK